ncbi:MAG: LLM class flavin-dependent oxidoreductase [Caldilineaceae bacterium]
MKIGVAIDHMDNSETGKSPSYQAIRSQAQVAEASGFDSIWLFDHLLFRFTPETTVGIWECWTLLSALAEATKRVELGTLVLCNPLRNPALLAKMAHTLDEVSSGRLILGIGAGWHQPEFDAFGYNFDRRVDRLEEALQIIKPLLHGEGIDFQGTHYQVQNCVITPLGPRTTGIPLLIGAGGPRMLRIVARYADQWNTAWLGKPQELTERLVQIRTACHDVGRDPATLAVTVAVQVAFPNLGTVDSMVSEPLSGSSEALAQAFHEYDQAGVAHLILAPTPHIQPAVERLAEAIHLYRRNG